MINNDIEHGTIALTSQKWRKLEKITGSNTKAMVLQIAVGRLLNERKDVVKEETTT